MVTECITLCLELEEPSGLPDRMTLRLFLGGLPFLRGVLQASFAEPTDPLPETEQ